MIQASRTFWEHGASEHLMVLGKIAKRKNVFSQERMIFLAKKGLVVFSLLLTLNIT